MPERPAPMPVRAARGPALLLLLCAPGCTVHGPVLCMPPPTMMIERACPQVALPLPLQATPQSQSPPPPPTPALGPIPGVMVPSLSSPEDVPMGAAGGGRARRLYTAR